jgi:hypothetical protein
MNGLSSCSQKNFLCCLKDWLSQDDMEASMKKILYWLTEAKGNFTGLEQEQLFPKSTCGLRCMQDMKKQLQAQRDNETLKFSNFHHGATALIRANLTSLS